MSDIIKARKLLTEALGLMTRDPPVRKARGKHVEITPALRKRVRSLAANYPDMTMHQIAVKVGLRNGGRVTGILKGDL